MVLTFGLLSTFTLGLTNTGHELCSEILSLATAVRGPVQPAPLERPQVLAIMRDREDQCRVVLTVAPRGYRVVVAETAARARETLRSDASRIGVVVIDAKIPGAESLAALARSLVPVAKVIRLPPNHTPTDVSKLLVDAI